MARFVVNSAGAVVLVDDALAQTLLASGAARPATPEEIRGWYQRFAPHVRFTEGQPAVTEGVTDAADDGQPRRTRPKRAR